MKRATVKYKKMSDGKIQIAGFQNVASLNELQDAFGKDVLYGYESSYPHFYRCKNEKDIWVVWGGGVSGQWDIFTPGQLLNKEKFEEFIRTLKKAGERLQKVKKFYADSETIKIIV